MDMAKTHDDLNNISKMKPSEFIEKYTNIKLFDYQKKMIDNFPKDTVYFRPARTNGRRLIRFYEACTHLSKMKDDDIIVLMKPDGWVKLNKEGFANYLLNEF